MAPAMSHGGWAGYSGLPPSLRPPTHAPSLRFYYIAPNLSWEDANATMNPFFAFAHELAANSSVETTAKLHIAYAKTFPVESFASVYNTYLANSAGHAGVQVEVTSRLLPRESIEQDYEKVAETLLALPSVGH